jgi:hypothetical protein
MRPRSPPSEVVITSVRMPIDIVAWLKQRATYYGGSYNAELVRCCRFAMEADAAKDRKVAKDRASAAAAEQRP